MCLVESLRRTRTNNPSQLLTAARVALRLRERLKLPRTKKGNPSDSKAKTVKEV